MTKQGLRNKNDTEVVHYGQTIPAYVCNSPCIKVCHFNKKPDEKQGEAEAAQGNVKVSSNLFR